MGSKSSSKRKVKRDKISSKKKSKRKESKKRRWSYDSDSSSSDDDSLHSGHGLSSVKKVPRRRITKSKHRRRESSLSDSSDYRSEYSDSDSSSTDENDYKSRKSRRSRVGLKDTKRKGRKRSVSSIRDVDTQSGRKRKRLGKDHDSRPIKKSSKKKSRKILSSSSDTDSKSCSASPSRSISSSEDNKRQKNKVVPDKKKGRLGRMESGKHKQKHRDRSPSVTSISRGSDPNVTYGNRDRSPSVGSIGRGSDPNVTYGNSDAEFLPVYNSRRLKSVIIVVNHPRDEEESRWEIDPNKEEIVYDQNEYPSPRSVDSNEDGLKIELGNQPSEVRELGQSRIDDGDRSNEGGHVKSFEEKEVDTSVLESILRQKALENLKKFRKMPQTSPRSNMVKINNETNLTRLSDGTVDIIQNDSIEQGISEAQETNPRDELLLQKEIPEAVKLPYSEHVEGKPRIAKLECSEEDKSSHARAAEAKAVSGGDTSPGAGGTKACSSSDVELTSSVEPTPLEHGSEKIDEVKDDSSEFEQKTMSVMRGGELVQVSYKVYIPKRAAALARRNLRR